MAENIYTIASCKDATEYRSYRIQRALNDVEIFEKSIIDIDKKNSEIESLFANGKITKQEKANLLLEGTVLNFRIAQNAIYDSLAIDKADEYYLKLCK